MPDRMERLADEFLGHIGPVGIGGIDEVHAELRQALQRRPRLSSGGPQMPAPVTRIAPKPSRWTVMSPPTLNDPDLRASSLDIFVFS